MKFFVKTKVTFKEFQNYTPTKNFPLDQTVTIARCPSRMCVKRTYINEEWIIHSLILKVFFRLPLAVIFCFWLYRIINVRLYLSNSNQSTWPIYVTKLISNDSNLMLTLVYILKHEYVDGLSYISMWILKLFQLKFR